MDLSTFVERIEKEGLRVRGIEVYQHGRKIASRRWAPNYRYPLHSLSKSFTSLAIGMLVDEGKLGVREKIVDLFPSLAPETPMPYLDELCVEHLLTMTTGHDHDVRYDPEDGYDEDDGVRFFLHDPIAKKPGTYFCYNQMATYTLSAIVTKLTGQTLCEYLTPRLFDPLGIENPPWQICSKGRNLGYTGLMLNTSEIAKLGILHLNRGVYEGKRLVSAEWIDKSGQALADTTPHKDGPDNEYGYGYQFWRCVPRAKAYRADGMWGQFIIISHELDSVVAVSSWEKNNAQGILTAIWDTITPQLEAAK